MLMYGRNQHNIVKQLSSDQKLIKFFKINKNRESQKRKRSGNRGSEVGVWMFRQSGVLMSRVVGG